MVTASAAAQAWTSAVGAAYRAGIASAERHGCGIVGQTDADTSGVLLAQEARRHSSPPPPASAGHRTTLRVRLDRHEAPNWRHGRTAHKDAHETGRVLVALRHLTSRLVRRGWPWGSGVVYPASSG